MALYDVVDGIYRKVAKKYDPVEGVYRKVQKAFDPVDGVYRQYFSSGVPASTLSVGDSVWLNVNGVSTEFLVVHQGNPDSAIYDASCDGTWLLMKDLYVDRVFDSSDNNYQNSDIHAYLNGDFIGLLDSNIQYAIKQVKIPYVKGLGDSGSALSGSNGLSTKIFLLSNKECHESGLGYCAGACLDYFNISPPTALWDTRRAYYNGTVYAWWLREPNEYNKNQIFGVNTQGMVYQKKCTTLNIFVRPAFILDSDTAITQADGKNIIA